MPSLDSQLRKEYEQLYHTCTIRSGRLAVVNSTVDTIAAHQSRYKAVSDAVGVPWFVIALIHSLEASQRFDRHLHNGDPLSARTVHVPRNRPPLPAQPPFTWEASATDALRFDGLAAWHDWSVPGILFKLEGFNGFGYRMKHPEVLSPYLWSFTNHYERGKFVADGQFSATAVSLQCGAAALLKRMEERGMVQLDGLKPVRVLLSGAPSGIPAVLDRDNTLIGVRKLVSALGGELTNVATEPFSATVRINQQTFTFPGTVVDGTGYVDFTDIMGQVYPTRTFSFTAGTNTLQIS